MPCRQYLRRTPCIGAGSEFFNTPIENSFARRLPLEWSTRGAGSASMNFCGSGKVLTIVMKNLLSFKSGLLSALASLLFVLASATPGIAQPSSSPATQGLKGGAQLLNSAEGITEYRLDNGLRFLLIPDPSVDTVTINMTYLVGSRNEGYGESGMAHLLEHLLFRGTPRFPNIKGELLKRGARFNGTTSNDRTNYFATLNASSENLDWIFALEADRMVHSNVSKEDLDAEMTVVRNEFESGENSPSGVLHKRVTATAYQWHNYGRSTIGARSDIENVPIERLRAFYRTYYQPDNAVLVVAGKFDTAQALDLVGKHFAGIPRPGRSLPATYTSEPVQDGERSVILRRVGDVQIVSAFYHLPAGSHPDHAALDILVTIFGHTPSGRLHKSLVQSSLASSVFGWEAQFREAGYAYFGSTVRLGQPIEAARDAMLSTVEGVSGSPVTAEEVETARTRLLNDIEMTIANSRSLALTLSETIAMGDWRLLFLHRDRLRKVTPADVNQVAARYFKAANRTVGMFVPTQMPDRAEIPPAPNLAEMLRGYQGDAKLAQGETFNPTPENIETRTLRRSLPGGMKVALLPKKTRGGTVVAQLGFRWGDEQSKAGKSIACGIAGAMLQRGTQKRSREQLSNEFSRLKASVGVSGEGASIHTIRENLPDALRLVAEILRQPSFPEAEFEQLRTASLSGLESQRSDPAALAVQELRRHIEPYSPEHWLYTASIDERIERIRKVRIEDVRACYQDLFGASDSELAVVGDFDPEQVSKLAQDLFGDWKSPRPYVRIVNRHQDVTPVDRTLITPDKANAVYRAAFSLPIKDDHPDFSALLLGNYILGGGSDSRLARRIREKEGLSYSVGSYFTAGSQDDKGEFGVSAIYAPENRERVESLIREELQTALTEGFSETEVNSAKKGYLEARQVARGQDAALAARLVAYLVLDRNFEWDLSLEKKISTLTSNQILQALRRHMDLSRLTTIKAGDFSKSRPPPGVGPPG